MSVVQYPRLGYFHVVNSSTHYLGSYELPQDGDLHTVQLRVYNKKAGPYSYTMKVEMALTLNGAALASSIVEVFSDTSTGQTGSDWLGHCVFKFDNYALMAGETYHFRLLTTGYIRPGRPNANTAYLAVACDWLEPLGSSNSAGAKAAIGVFR